MILIQQLKYMSGQTMLIPENKKYAPYPSKFYKVRVTKRQRITE